MFGVQGASATKDVDAIFEPVKEIRNASHRIAERHDLRLDWLNLAVKTFVVDHPRQILFDLSNLIVTVPEADYLLAMKMLALRSDTEDENDAEFLIARLGLKSSQEVINIVADYYPKKEVKLKTVFWLNEYFAE